MRFVLWIDDAPSRFSVLDGKLPADVCVVFAHGFDQINYYLRYSGINFSLVILDHDMPAMSGTEVLAEFGEELRFKNVFICSENERAVGAMREQMGRIREEPLSMALLVTCPFSKDGFAATACLLLS